MRVGSPVPQTESSTLVSRRIYRRASGRYTVNFRDAAGTIGWCTRGTLAEAEQTRDELDRLAALGLRLPAQTTTVRELAAQWLRDFEEQVRRRQRSAHTLARYREVAGTQLLPHLGRSNVRTIDRFAVDRFSEALQQHGLSPATVALTLRTLSALMAYAVKHRWHAYNPVKERSKQQPLAPRATDTPSAEQQVVRHLSDDELERLLGWTLPPWQAAFTLAAMTGVRTSELLAVRWEDIDQAEGRLRVNRHLTAGVVAEYRTKDPRRRTILLPKGTVETEAIVTAVPENSTSPHPADLILPGRHGRARTPRGLDIAFKAAAQRAELGSKLTASTLRDTFAVNLILRGMPCREISEQLGHGSFESVYRRYRPHFSQAGRADEAKVARQSEADTERAKRGKRRRERSASRPIPAELSGRRLSMPLDDVSRRTQRPWGTIRHLCDAYVSIVDGQRIEMVTVPFELVVRPARKHHEGPTM